MKKVTDQYYIEDYGIIAYIIEGGSIILPVGPGNIYCEWYEYAKRCKDANVKPDKNVEKLFDLVHEYIKSSE